jgi:hypothetical protein
LIKRTLERVVSGLDIAVLMRDAWVVGAPAHAVMLQQREVKPP